MMNLMRVRNWFYVVDVSILFYELFFNKGWILLTQNKASRGYKYNEYTPVLCITRMDTSNTTELSSFQVKCHEE